VDKPTKLSFSIKPKVKEKETKHKEKRKKKVFDNESSDNDGMKLFLGNLSHSGDLLLSVSRTSYVVRKLLNIFSFFSGTTEPISTRFAL
jgi:hypothetical protein